MSQIPNEQSRPVSSGRFSQPRAPRPQGEGSPRPAGAPRPQPGTRPAGTPRPQSGVRPSGAPRPQPGTHPAGAPRPQPGTRPAGASRPQAGRPGQLGTAPRRPRPQTPGSGASGGQPPRRPRQNPPGRSGHGRSPLLLGIIALLILGSIGLLVLSLSLTGGDSRAEATLPSQDMALGTLPPEEAHKKPSRKETEAPTEALTEPPLEVVSSAKVTVTGDLLIHKSLINQSSAVYQGEKGYNFDPIFKYLNGYTDQADYAIANLETTLFGPGKPYSGNPKFNTPDELVDGAKKVGFDMLLTANNHCNDTDLDGVLRTLKVVREKGLQTLGTNLNSEEDKYVIQDIGGIQIGMLCYTYEDSRDPNQVTFNYNPLPSKAKDLVCSFPKFQDAKSRDPFYQQLEAQIAEMKQKGAEAIVLFVHWGEEYHLEASSDQRNMAQRFCDLGVDLIVGGHPHVVQPIELLTSNVDPEHKTVCLYSLGNAVSNQRREEMSKSCPTGHTEDGMLFSFTFRKYSDGSVRLGSVEVIPTWVNMFTNAQNKREYNILPLEQARRDQWQEMFAIAPGLLPSLDASYQRTMDIVGSGLETANAWLSGNAS